MRRPPSLPTHRRPAPDPPRARSNIDASGVPAVDGLLKKFVVKKFGPYKVGLVGWITPDTAFAATNAGGFKFGAVAASVKACLAELRQAHKDVHLIIGLSHTGQRAAPLGFCLWRLLVALRGGPAARRAAAGRYKQRARGLTAPPPSPPPRRL